MVNLPVFKNSWDLLIIFIDYASNLFIIGKKLHKQKP